MADETTQPGVRKPAAAAATTGDKIIFRCPKGHRIVAKVEMAGHRGKCSKCGTPVQIPGGDGAAVPQLPGDASPAAPQAASAAAGEAAPAGEGEPAAAVESAAEAGRPAGQNPSDASASGDLFAGISLDGESHGSGFVAAGEVESAIAPVEMPVAFEGNPNVMLLARLFEQMDHGGVVEIHVTGGSVILPEFYDPRWSTGSLGLFASRAADGTVTLTAVAWEAIQKIVVRKVEGLPDGMFE
jgi:hypothetical protein